MRQFLLIGVIGTLAISLVCGDQSVKVNSIDGQSMKSDENANSVKIKRGIHGYASGIGYSLPPHSPNYMRYTPYARFPGIYKSPIGPPYALTPGNAVVHSYSATYPKPVLRPILRPAIPPPVLVQKPFLPVPSVPIYANRYPIFVPRPVGPKPLVPVPTVPVPAVTQFGVPSFVTNIPTHIHPANPVPAPIPASIPFSGIVPQPTLISQDGWRPVFSSVPSVSTAPVNPPSVSVLPPFGSLNLPSTSASHRPNNYYLPPDPADVATHSVNNGLAHANEQYQQQQYQHQQQQYQQQQYQQQQYQQYQQNDLQAHLQQLNSRQAQEIQHHHNFLRSENEVATPLSEQGYETASNEGRYSGPSSYEVALNSRGLLQ